MCQTLCYRYWQNHGEQPQMPTLADPWSCGLSINHRPPNGSCLTLLMLTWTNSNLRGPAFLFPVALHVMGSSPVHCRLLGSIFDSYPSIPGADPLPQLWQPKMSPDIAKCALGKKLPMVENHHFRGATQFSVYSTFTCQVPPLGKEGPTSQLQFLFPVTGSQWRLSENQAWTSWAHSHAGEAVWDSTPHRRCCSPDPRKWGSGREARWPDEGHHLCILAQTRDRKTQGRIPCLQGSQWSSSFSSWLDWNTRSCNCSVCLLLSVSGDSLHWEGGSEFHPLMKAWSVKEEGISLRGSFCIGDFVPLPKLPRVSSHLAARQRWGGRDEERVSAKVSAIDSCVLGPVRWIEKRRKINDVLVPHSLIKASRLVVCPQLYKLEK